MFCGLSLPCFKTCPMALAIQGGRPELDTPGGRALGGSVALRCPSNWAAGTLVHSHLESGLCLCHWLEREQATWTLGRYIPKAPLRVAWSI